MPNSEARGFVPEPDQPASVQVHPWLHCKTPQNGCRSNICKHSTQPEVRGTQTSQSMLRHRVVFAFSKRRGRRSAVGPVSEGRRLRSGRSSVAPRRCRALHGVLQVVPSADDRERPNRPEMRTRSVAFEKAEWGVPWKI